MNRRVFILLHLYLSAFFTAAVALMALSGGFYLLDIKGEMRDTRIAELDIGGAALAATPDKASVLATLERAGVDGFRFDYVRGNGKTLYTRPTSRRHYRLDIRGDRIEVTQRDPDLVASMIELHKGHGPSAFRTFQQLLAAGLVFMVISGAWLGLSASRLRVPTALTAVAGIAVVALLVAV